MTRAAMVPTCRLAAVLIAGAAVPVGANGQGVDVSVAKALPHRASNSFEPTAVEVRIGSVAKIVVARENGSGTILVPVGAVLALAEVAYEESQGVGRARLEPSGVDLRFDASGHRVRRERAWQEVAPEALVRVDGALFAAPSVLEFALGVRILRDREDAAMEFRDADALPVSRRLARARAREGAHRDVATASPGAPVTTSLRPGLVLDYGVVHSRTVASEGRDVSSTTVGTGLQVPLGSGVLMTHLRTDATGTALDEATWVRTWPGRSRLSSLTLGTVVTAGPRAQVLDGIAMTNAALGSRGVVDLGALHGSLAQGWSLDAWQGGRLVGSAVEPGQPYDLRVPLTEGSTLVELVAAGPSGQERTWQRLFHTPPLYVPRHRLEYAIAAGACRAEATFPMLAGRVAPCRGAATTDLRYGISRSWVVRAGVDASLAGSRESVSRPYGGLSGVIAGVSTVDVTLGAGRRGHPMGSGRLVIEPTPSWIVVLDGERGVQTDVSGVPSRRPGSFRLFARSSPAVFRRRLAVEASSFDVATERLILAQRRVDLTLQLPVATVRTYVRRESNGNDGLLRSTGTWTGATGTLLPGRWLGATWLRGGAEWQAAGVRQWHVALARPMGRWRFDVGVARRAHHGPPALSLSFVSQGNHAQASTLMRSGEGLGGPHLSQALRGSLTWDALSGALVPSTEGGRGRSGVGGTVFLDLDEDGTLDAGEPGLRDMRVRIDHRIVTTDANGRFLSWGLPTNSVVQLAADTAALASPLWLPRDRQQVVRTAAGAVVTANVPILAGGAIEGRIQAPQGAVFPWPAVRLTRVADGHVIRLVPFPDGSFYAEALRPGAYELGLEGRHAPAPARVVVGAARVARAAGHALAGLPDLDAGSVTVVIPLQDGGR